jgi:hypothetical protein
MVLRMRGLWFLKEGFEKEIFLFLATPLLTACEDGKAQRYHKSEYLNPKSETNSNDQNPKFKTNQRMGF